MKSAYLDYLDEIDFRLPSVDNVSLGQLPGKRSANPKVYLGTSGWNDKRMASKLYPPKTPVKKYFESYAKIFNAVEIQSTKFAKPKAEILREWYERSSSDFKFVLLMPQYISYQRHLDAQEIQDDFHQFWNLAVELKEKLASLYISLPAHFNPKRLEELYHFLDALPSNVPLHLDFKNKKINESEKHLGIIINENSKRGIHTSFVDSPERRDMLHLQLSSTTAFVRFIGNRLHASDYTRIDNWVRQLSYWLENGMENIYFYIFQPSPDKHLAWPLIKYMKDALDEKGISVEMPK